MTQSKRFNFNRYLFIFAAVFFAAAQITSPRMLAQSQNKNVSPSEIVYSASSNTNDVSSITNVNPGDALMSSEKQDLLRQLEAARTSNNMMQKTVIEDKLHQLDGTGNVIMTKSSNIIIGFAGNTPTGTEGDYNTSMVTNGGFFSAATQTNPSTFPNPGRVWAGVTLYNPSGSDTCKIYYSDNGGQNWNFAYYLYFGSNMDFRNSELDLELAYDGSVVWVYGVAGYTDLTNGKTGSILFRFNTTTNTYNGYILSWPGSATATNMYYNPRITSDNSNYTGSTYIYLSCSFDSTYSGSQHFNRQKYAHLETPFAVSNTINYGQPNSNGGFFWNSSGLTAGTYLYTDLAYFKTSTSNNRIFTVYNVPGSSLYNMYLAWSDDYGATVTGSSIITEANYSKGAKIVFNGGTSNYNGMIAYIRQYTATDWDPYYRNTVDGGANWTSGYIDQSSKFARSVDVIAPRGAANIFKVGYTQDSTAGTYGYYTGGIPGTWNAPNPMAVSPAGVDTTFTKVVAGFRNGGGDDCFSLYSTGTGANVYSSRLCFSTVGISGNNNEVPDNFSLQQNYPNPFNPATTIKFSIPVGSFVKLTVFDAAGKVVTELVNEELSAGNYDYSFSALNLASGVYFYKLTAGDFSAVKKMLLVK